MVYEYRCKKCGASFEVTATVAEKTAGIAPVCPHCGSKEVSQSFAGVGVLTGSRTADPSSACGPGCGCS